MADPQRRVRYNGSPNQKIVEANRNQGVEGIQNMQGTTRIIYDAVKLATSAVSNTYNLFENCKTRQFPLTNLTENKLQVGESIAMQRFSCFIIECTAGTTDAQAVVPFAYFSLYQKLYASVMSFSIAQDQVIKKLPLSAMFAPFNKRSNFYGYFQIQVAAADPVTAFQLPQDVYAFDNNIVIPPQVEFIAQIQVPPLTVVAGFDTYLCMQIEGLGSLYSPKSNY